MVRGTLFKTAAPLVVLTFLAVYKFPTVTEEEIAARNAVEQSVYYDGCNEVRNAGKDPLYRGDASYGEHMDGDGDGVARTPY